MGAVGVLKAALRLGAGASAAGSRLLKSCVEERGTGWLRSEQGSEQGSEQEPGDEPGLEAGLCCSEASAASALNSAASLLSA